MKYNDLIKIFKDRHPDIKVEDYRPICHELFTDDKVGITIWLEGGEIRLTIPLQASAEDVATAARMLAVIADSWKGVDE